MQINKKTVCRSAIALMLLLILVMTSMACSGTSAGGAETTTGEVTTVGNVPAVTDPPQTDDSEIQTNEDSTEPTVPAATETEAPPAEDKIISFLACGDNIVYRPAAYEAADRAVEGGRKYNFKPIYKNVADMIAAADVAFINQETVIAGAEYGISGYPTFNTPEAIANDLVELGFDVVSLANNHILDMREAGLLNTINYWRDLPVLSVGAYLDDADAASIRVLERNGVKIAFLAYTYSANGRTVRKDSPLIVSFYKDPDKNSPTYGEIYEERLADDVAAARSVADVVVVSVHWGNEDTQKVSNEQKKVAAILCDAGADVILGHHPHVLQSIEYIKSSDGTHSTLCAYSLGNFLGMQGYDYNALAGMLSFNIRVGADGVSTECVHLTPIVSYFEKDFRSNEIYLLSDFTDELCQKHCVVQRGGDGTFGGRLTLSSLRYYLNNAIADDYLADEFKSAS